MQSSIFVSHLLPLYPIGHLQLKSDTMSIQVPPLKHLLGVQSSMLLSQYLPLKPLAQRQLYVLTPSYVILSEIRIIYLSIQTMSEKLFENV